MKRKGRKKNEVIKTFNIKVAECLEINRMDIGLSLLVFVAISIKVQNFKLKLKLIQAV